MLINASKVNKYQWINQFCTPLSMDIFVHEIIMSSLLIFNCLKGLTNHDNELSVDCVLPINGHFKYEFDTSGIDLKPGVNIFIKLTYSKKKFLLEVPYTQSCRSFFAEVNKAQDAHLSQGDTHFDWLFKYRSSSNNSLTMNCDQLFLEQQERLLVTTLQQASLTPNDITSSLLKSQRDDLHSSSGSSNSIQGSKDNGDLGKIGRSNFYVTDLESPDGFGNIPRDMVALGTATPLAARDSHIRLQMAMFEEHYTELQNFNIFIGSWNVNGQSCTVSLGEHWLSVDQSPPDLYAIGFQELDLSKEAFVFNDTSREEEWAKACAASLHPEASYIKIKLVRLIGMMLIVFVKKDLEQFVTNVAAETVGTGILKMGNKGGVAIRFDFHDTSMCFVNSHLAAHVEEYERRNQDYNDICNRMVFNQFKPPKFIKDHDQVYWFGDLNYRLMNLTRDQVKKMLDEQSFEDLFKYDQLKDQWEQKKIFKNFQEGQINHSPTYKYDPGTDNWDSSEKNRPPAWCDRCLWKGETIRLLNYRSHPQLKLSDHKPISALFESSVKVKNVPKYRKIFEEVMKKWDRLENEFLPQVTVDQTELNFDLVTFRCPVRQSLSIANTGQVPVRFEFIQKPNEVGFCKPWLQIQPYESMIKPGDKLDVELTVFVDIQSGAAQLNSGLEKIYDILVLHLDGGKDLFIEVKGSYKPSCFGSSIEALIRLKSPVDQVPVEHFYELHQKKDLAGVLVCWDIPKEIWLLVDHIFKYGLMQEDLFQQPGLHSQFQTIREEVDKGEIKGRSTSIHSVAEALLIFFEALSEPLIPYNYYEKAIDNYHNFIASKQIINDIPDSHRKVFYYLVSFMRELLRHSNHNRLDNKILSSIFGGLVLRAPPSGHPMWKESKSSHSSIQEIDKKKAGFIHHFLVNDFDP
ncbi:oculocerebrorenal syndrome of Lowe isoform X2 [Brevipalpus obovatus]|uniref:oculocerebrorenal syndrome of Lowe isoform X2 n=1 Tax=Brevipalpus obovatus TaxID=246614 RepID=UPI003D9DCE41